MFGRLDFVNRWLILIAVATTLLAISMFVLRINIRTAIIFYIIGISVVTLWMIIDARYFSAQRRNIQPAQACTCPVCKHDFARECLNEKCACCLLTKDEKVVGHSSSSLQ